MMSNIRQHDPVDMNENELWDVYTKDREKTGRLHRRGDRMKEGDYHLVVHVCIFNRKGQLLIQQRQPFKHGWPNMWDLTVGGSAVAGDSSAKAAERELYEELGIKVDLSQKRPNFTIHFDNGFDDYYLIEQDVDLATLRLQETEVQCARWADKEEVLRMQEEGTMIPYWFLDKLFEIRDFYGARDNQNPGHAIRVEYATQKNLASWMSFAQVVRWNFPGLETEEQLVEYRNTVIKNIERGSAVCALSGNMVVGILLFSVKHNMLSCMAVHPEFRRQGIATRMMELMLAQLDRSRDITVKTFREDDEKGVAPRALYKSLGFVPGELCVELDYPQQEFVLRGKKD